MKTLFKSLFTVAILGFCIHAEVRAQENKVLDGVFIKETAPTRRVIPYTHVREADVEYVKRVWREIDVKQKLNHPLYYPLKPIKELGYIRMSLYDIIKQGIEEGTLTAYNDESFTEQLSKTEASERTTTEEVMYDEDLETGETKEVTIKNEVEGVDIVKYWVKEDWFFDRERSVMEVRILGLLPIIKKIDGDGNFQGFKDLYWIYFPEARYVFANHEVYNSGNDGARLTYEDLFRKRMFSSYIHQETNVYDNRLLSDYVKGVDRLLESKRIEQEIINHEHDMWQY